MGTSTNGQICFGIAFEEEFEFPWTDDDQSEIEDWWVYQVHGFKHSLELYDAEGNNLNGRKPSEAQCDQYFGEKREFFAAHPLPVELVTHCSGDCPMFILAVPGTLIENRRGDPTAFDPAALTVTPEQVAALLEFCRVHGIEVESEPQWYLTSMWG